MWPPNFPTWLTLLVYRSPSIPGMKADNYGQCMTLPSWCSSMRDKKLAISRRRKGLAVGCIKYQTTSVCHQEGSDARPAQLSYMRHRHWKLKTETTTLKKLEADVSWWYFGSISNNPSGRSRVLVNIYFLEVKGFKANFFYLTNWDSSTRNSGIHSNSDTL